MAKNKEEKVKEKRFLKVGAVSPKIRLGDVAYNTRACIEAAKRACAEGVRLLVFPELTLTGATCGDMLNHKIMLQRAESGLKEFIAATEELDIVSCIGMPGDSDNIVAVVYRGKLTGLLCAGDLHEWNETRFTRDGAVTAKFAGFKTELISDGIFVLPSDESITVGILGEFDDEFCPHVAISLDSEETVIGSRAKRLESAARVSKAWDIPCVFANSGVGESTTDAVYSAHNIIADRGEILKEAEPFAKDNLVFADAYIEDFNYEDILDELDEISFDEDWEEEKESFGLKAPKLEKRRDMFLPEDEEGRRIACLEAFELQSQALAARIERSYSKTMVIGVSGGLDSTLALLVCARSADILGMDRKSVIGVTMPCFGTTKRTRSNAEKLSEALGISFRTVDIKASVIQHLKDIGHDGVTPDVTYENAQARERTQVIMDIANMTGGLVVGTGDLSELALGWATYNGDHMSMYAVNASVPKTMVRRIVEVYSERDRKAGGNIADILDDILATPVSPELLPPKDGEIAQCTEALVGPYELHDYFLYYMLERELSPRRIYDSARFDFDGVYDSKTILGWLRVFVRRFFSQQFKRSCMPDGPKVGCISVSPRCGLSMPSDMSAAVWLEELDRIEEEEK